MQSENWMAREHSWTRVSHDFLCFLAFLGLVTVDWAVGTRCLLLLEGTFIQAHLGVFEECGTFCAQFTLSVVLVLAVDIDHGFDGFLLTFHPRVLFSSNRQLNHSSQEDAWHPNKLYLNSFLRHQKNHSPPLVSVPCVHLS